MNYKDFTYGKTEEELAEIYARQKEFREHQISVERKYRIKHGQAPIEQAYGWKECRQ